MDRFEDTDEVFWEHIDRDLHSSMDRFEAKAAGKCLGVTIKFTFQYG